MLSFTNLSSIRQKLGKFNLLYIRVHWVLGLFLGGNKSILRFQWFHCGQLYSRHNKAESVSSISMVEYDSLMHGVRFTVDSSSVIFIQMALFNFSFCHSYSNLHSQVHVSFT